MIQKPQDMLCGSACVHYIANVIRKMNVNVPKNFCWISDLATFATNRLHLSVQLSCYDSRLYNDFQTAKKPSSFDGFRSIEKFFRYTTNSIYNIEISSSIIEKLLASDYLLILNVSSAIFNDDPSMNGGHFVVVLDHDDKNFKMVNPLSEQYEIIDMPKEKIISSCNCFGNWMLAVK